MDVAGKQSSLSQQVTCKAQNTQVCNLVTAGELEESEDEGGEGESAGAAKLPPAGFVWTWALLALAAV